MKEEDFDKFMEKINKDDAPKSAFLQELGNVFENISDYVTEDDDKAVIILAADGGRCMVSMKGQSLSAAMLIKSLLDSSENIKGAYLKLLMLDMASKPRGLSDLGDLLEKFNND